MFTGLHCRYLTVFIPEAQNKIFKNNHCWPLLMSHPGYAFPADCQVNVPQLGSNGIFSF